MHLVKSWHDPFHLGIKTADRMHIDLQIILKPNLQKTLPITLHMHKEVSATLGQHDYKIVAWLGLEEILKILMLGQGHFAHREHIGINGMTEV